MKKVFVKFFAKLFEVFAKFSRSFSKFSQVFEVFASFSRLSNPFGPIGMHSEAIGSVWTFSKNFESFWIFESFFNVSARNFHKRFFSRHNIDVDSGGTIDMDEFLEFFQRVSDIEAMRMDQADKKVTPCAFLPWVDRVSGRRMANGRRRRPCR